MSVGARVTAALYVLAVAWDLVCPPGQTVSEAVARGLADRRTRWPLTALIVATVVHLFALARSYD